MQTKEHLLVTEKEYRKWYKQIKKGKHYHITSCSFLGYLLNSYSSIDSSITDCGEYSMQLTFISSDLLAFSIPLVLSATQAAWVRKYLPDYDMSNRHYARQIFKCATDFLFTDMTYIEMGDKFVVFCQDQKDQPTFLDMSSQVYISMEIFRNHFSDIDTEGDGDKWAESVH